MFAYSARRLGKRGDDLKHALARLALAARHLDFQIDGMKTNRQGLHAPDSLALSNHIPTAATGTNKELVQRLDGNEDAAMFNVRPGRTVTFKYSENLV
jgi:hypothetical protein